MWAVPDFETRSYVDLNVVGSEAYAQHPSTEIICLIWNIEDTEPAAWVPGEPFPEALRFLIETGGTLVPHKVDFDRTIWREIGVKQHGFPDVPDDQWYDSMATAAMKNLPLNLKNLSRALKVDQVKSEAPPKFFKPDPKTGAFNDDVIPAVIEYGLQDGRAQTAVFKRIGVIPPAEMEVWRLDQKINQRGIMVDLPYVKVCRKICEEAAGPLVERFIQLTGVKPTQVAKAQAWVKEQGIDLPNFQKETIDQLLNPGDSDDEQGESQAGEISSTDFERTQTLPSHVREALEIKQSVNSASIKKLDRFLQCVGVDGRARNLLQYHGAATGRWAGRTIQPTNFPRVDKAFAKAVEEDPDYLYDIIMTGDAATVAWLTGGDPIRAVASGLRHALCAAPGKMLVVGDFATIEARIVLALAGQHNRVEDIKNGAPIYEDMAEIIYGYKVNKKDNPTERQVGKGAVLGCGFQMGWRKFLLQTLKQTGLKLDEDLAQRTVTAYRQDFAPCVPRLWNALQDACIDAVMHRKPQVAFGIEYRLEDGFLTTRLPSGRKLWYYQPKIVHKAMPWDEEDIRPAVQYMARKNGMLKPVIAYGGLNTENAVQALARDLLVHAMKKAETENYPVLLNVYDELICEVEECRADEKTLEQIMTDTPQWAKELGVPVAAEVWKAPRYRK